MRAPKFEECPARLVLEKDMQDFISEAFGKEYDLLKGTGNPEAGSKIVFDFRTCAPSIADIMQIGAWRDGDEEQPDAYTMLNNLVVSGRMEGGIYILIFPYRAW